jgi:hypothetical protein
MYRVEKAAFHAPDFRYAFDTAATVARGETQDQKRIGEEERTRRKRRNFEKKVKIPPS